MASKINHRNGTSPIVTLDMGSYPLIFISNQALAHQALIQHGAIFADRPEPPLTVKIMSSNQHNINSASYGSKWRILRRNWTSQILHPSKSKEFSSTRKWVLDILLSHLKQGLSASSPIDFDPARVSGVVKVIDHFRFAMFCLLVFMCFGDKMDETRIREVEEVVNRLLLSFTRYQILNLWPWMTQVLLRSRWNEFFNSWKKQEDVLIPCIKSRKQVHYLEEKVTCYVCWAMIYHGLKTLETGVPSSQD